MVERPDDSRHIHRDDLEAKLRALQGDINQKVSNKKDAAVTAGVGAGVLAIVIAYLVGRRGRRRGRSRRVEVRGF
ncbi:MAG: hypothetical protein FJ267_20060 [Planctomycetes bacterium]|nr:hypothetical protein [Actinomycetota bacterium]MBM4077930.1 hypothetical protein [Planctomycetota bacterium]